MQLCPRFLSCWLGEAPTLRPAPAPPARTLPADLPDTLARAEGLDRSGGYLLLGVLPELDIALYCDNAQVRDTAHLRYGEHFQSFDQEIWSDPTVLPRLTWSDGADGALPGLAVHYLSHQGTFFDGERYHPGLAGEEVVCQWDGTQWTDVHFRSHPIPYS